MGRHLRSSTRDDRRQHPHGPYFGTEKPGGSEPFTSGRHRRRFHPRRTPSSRLQALVRMHDPGLTPWISAANVPGYGRASSARTDLRAIARDVVARLRVRLRIRHARVIPAGMQNGSLAAFHGVRYPTTLAEAGSDLHRACLARLCCAFRFSQPLDALFRPQPFQPCFMPVAPLGFRFQRFSLPGSGTASRRFLPFVPFQAAGQSVGQDGSCSNPAARIYALGESVPSRPELPGICRPILS
jgi:hypothetical protein